MRPGVRSRRESHSARPQDRARADRAGANIVRFGVPVAVARPADRTGALVHVHNVRSQYLNNDEDHYE